MAMDVDFGGGGSEFAEDSEPAPPPKKTARTTKAAGTKKAAPAKKPAARGKKKAIEESEEEIELPPDEDDEEDDEPPPPKKRTNRAATLRFVPLDQGASSVLITSSANPRRKRQRKRRRQRKQVRVAARKVSLRSRLPVLAQHGQRLVAQERRRLKWSVFSSLISVLRHTNVHSRLTLTTATIEDSLLRSLCRSTRGIVATLGTVEMPVMKFPEVEVLVYLCHLFLCYWYLVLLSSSAIQLRSSLSLIFN